MRRIFSALICLLLAVVGGVNLSACQGEAGGDDDGRLDIVVTTGMIGDVARQVAGGHGRVTVLMGPGVDPHLFNPSSRDGIRLDRADLVLYNGLLLEGRMTDVLASLHEAGRAVYAVAERVDPELLLAPEEFEGAYDPHLWMDVGAWAQVVDAVADILAEVDPDHAEEYRANAAAYRAELEELDAYVRQVIASIPASRRVLVTAHDAFNYFGRAYDIEVRGVYGISTESEAGVRELNRLVDYVIERQVPAVFAETTVDERAVLSLLAGAARRGHAMVHGGELFSDAMGARDTYEGTYIGMIDHNATAIALALGGEAPAGGFRGELTMIEPPVPVDQVEGVDDAGEVFE